MIIERYVNKQFTSNTYVLKQAKSPGVWLVDLGAFDLVKSQMSSDQYVAGVLLTHYHYDHIYFINTLLDAFPNCRIFASDHTIHGLYDPKMNLSFYHEDPVIFKGSHTITFEDADDISLFDDQNKAVAYATPGHNPGCLTFKIGNYLFTGDSYIPGLDVVTKLKGGDKKANFESLSKILSLLQPDTIICPGHGVMISAKKIIHHLKRLIVLLK